jgi:DNA-binding NarL/FixJ family response regulator
MTIRIAVVDDQALVRGGLSMVLNHQDDMEIVLEARSGLEAVSQAKAAQPDVILMDIRMPGMDGLEATSQIMQEADWPVKILILTTFDPDEYIYKALKAGASGFALKDIPPEDLVQAVRTVAEGGALFAPSVTKRLISRFTAGGLGDAKLREKLQLLTARENDVLVYLAKGYSNLEISESLSIGSATVKTHVSSLLSKLGLRDRAQAVVFAYESGHVVASGFDTPY